MQTLGNDNNRAKSTISKMDGEHGNLFPESSNIQNMHKLYTFNLGSSERGMRFLSFESTKVFPLYPYD